MCKVSILTLKWKVKFHTDYVYANKLYQNISADLTKQAERIGGTKKSVSEEKNNFCSVLPFQPSSALIGLHFPLFLCLLVPYLILVSLCSVGLTNLPASNDLLSLPLYTSSLNTTWFISSPPFALRLIVSKSPWPPKPRNYKPLQIFQAEQSI